MDLKIEKARRGGAWAVRLTVSLDRRETNELFLDGDKLISWPTDGMLSTGESRPLDRSSMFLSEIVSRPMGLELLYASEAEAERAGRILSYQIESSLPCN